jgi:hypothetical protein
MPSRSYRRFKHALGRADRAAEDFLNSGFKRWETERRLHPSEIAGLRSHLSSGEVRDPLHHLGVYLVLSVVLMVPIPGVRSLARFIWTLTYWGKTRWRSFRRVTAESSRKATNVHTPLVMALSLIPGPGAVAYMGSRPPRRKLLIRMMLDQAAIKLPFGIYRRMRLGRPGAPLRPHLGRPAAEVLLSRNWRRAMVRPAPYPI